VAPFFFPPLKRTHPSLPLPKTRLKSTPYRNRWADPAAAILLSLYILAVWSRVFKGQVEKIVGKGADAETMSKLEAIAAAHDTERVFVDVIRAWHSGERIFTEVEIVRCSHVLILVGRRGSRERIKV
jgi:divalent metal cation (Fe/Co/Zn/Cd) transporter